MNLIVYSCAILPWHFRQYCREMEQHNCIIFDLFRPSVRRCVPSRGALCRHRPSDMWLPTLCAPTRCLHTSHSGNHEQWGKYPEYICKKDGGVYLMKSTARIIHTHGRFGVLYPSQYYSLKSHWPIPELIKKANKRPIAFL